MPSELRRSPSTVVTCAWIVFGTAGSTATIAQVETPTNLRVTALREAVRVQCLRSPTGDIPTKITAKIGPPGGPHTITREINVQTDEDHYLFVVDGLSDDVEYGVVVVASDDMGQSAATQEVLITPGRINGGPIVLWWATPTAALPALTEVEHYSVPVLWEQHWGTPTAVAAAVNSMPPDRRAFRPQGLPRFYAADASPPHGTWTWYEGLDFLDILEAGTPDPAMHGRMRSRVEGMYDQLAGGLWRVVLDDENTQGWSYGNAYDPSAHDAREQFWMDFQNSPIARANAESDLRWYVNLLERTHPWLTRPENSTARSIMIPVEPDDFQARVDNLTPQDYADAGWSDSYYDLVRTWTQFVFHKARSARIYWYAIIDPHVDRFGYAPVVTNYDWSMSTGADGIGIRDRNNHPLTSGTVMGASSPRIYRGFDGSLELTALAQDSGDSNEWDPWLTFADTVQVSPTPTATSWQEFRRNIHIPARDIFADAAAGSTLLFFNPQASTDADRARRTAETVLQIVEGLFVVAPRNPAIGEQWTAFEWNESTFSACYWTGNDAIDTGSDPDYQPARMPTDPTPVIHAIGGLVSVSDVTLTKRGAFIVLEGTTSRPRSVDDSNETFDVYSPARIIPGASTTLTAGSCPADYNQDGVYDALDLPAFFSDYNNTDPAADFNRDGSLTYLDYLAYLSATRLGC